MTSTQRHRPSMQGFHSWLVVALSLILSVACKSTAEPSDPNQLQPSSFQQGVLEPGRLYSIAVPATYTGNESVPLILALHYGGHGSPYYGLEMLAGMIEPALRRLEAIIVAPDCTGANWTDPQSEQDVLDLLDYMEDTYNIDSDRTLVTGFSMGGIGTWHMAAYHPERFTAAIVMAGAPAEGTPGDDWQVPLYIIHSSSDEILPIEHTEAAVNQLTEDGFPVEFLTVHGVGHYNTAQFAYHLHEALPWLEGVWEN